MVFRCPNIEAPYRVSVICSNLGYLKIMNFPLEQWKIYYFLGVPILKHIMVKYLSAYHGNC